MPSWYKNRGFTHTCMGTADWIKSMVILKFVQISVKGGERSKMVIYVCSLNYEDCTIHTKWSAESQLPYIIVLLMHLEWMLKNSSIWYTLLYGTNAVLLTCGCS